jgi:RES domain
LVLRRYGYAYTSGVLSAHHAQLRTVNLDLHYAFLPSRSYAVSRYTDGGWPVLYTATADLTAICEVGYHARKAWQAARTSGSGVGRNYHQTKKLLYALDIDCMKQTVVPPDSRLTDPSDYSYCHSVARVARASGSTSLSVPSARHFRGICVPVLSHGAVKGGVQYMVPFVIRWLVGKDELRHTATVGRRGEKFSLWK